MSQGNSARDNFDWNGANTNYTLALQESQQFGTNSSRRIDTLMELARARYELRQYPEAESLLQERIEIGKALTWTNTIYYVYALELLADTQVAQKKYAVAEENCLYAESVIEYRYSRMVLEFGMLIRKRANLYAVQGKFDKAETCFKEARQELEFLMLDYNPNSVGRAVIVMELGGLFNDFGCMRLRQQRHAEAEDFLKKAVYYKGYEYGFSSPKLVDSLNNLAILYAFEDKYEQAEKTVQRSVKILNKKKISNQPIVAETEQLLADIQQHKKPVLAANYSSGK